MKSNLLPRTRPNQTIPSRSGSGLAIFIFRCTELVTSQLTVRLSVTMSALIWCLFRTKYAASAAPSWASCPARSLAQLNGSLPGSRSPPFVSLLPFCHVAMLPCCMLPCCDPTRKTAFEQAHCYYSIYIHPSMRRSMCLLTGPALSKFVAIGAIQQLCLPPIG